MRQWRRPINPASVRIGGNTEYDAEMNALQDNVSEALAGRMIDAGRQRMAPIGNTIDAQRLVPYQKQATDGMSAEEARHIPAAVFNPGIYADMVQLLVPLASGQEVLAVPRPKNTRIFLLIQNTNLANLYVAFDQVATTAGMVIPPSGTAFFDIAVPQNDIHIVYGAAVATVVPIFYMNADIARAVSQ